MSYDEHLISMAGGDGETVDQLAAIEARAQAAIVERESNFLDLRQFAPVIRAIDESSTDVPALLAMVREQRAKLDRVEAQAARWATLSDGHAYYAKRIRHAIKGPPSIRAAITATEEGK